MNLTKTEQIEKNYSDFRIKMTSLMTADYKIGKNYSYTNAVWPSGIFDINLNTEKEDKICDELVDKVYKGELPKKIMTGPSTKPDTYDKLFAKHNIQFLFEAKGMSLDLNEFDFLLGEEDYSIKRIDNPIFASFWATVVGRELLKLKTDSEIKFLTSMVKKAIMDNQIILYGAFFNEELVGTSMLYLNDEIAGIYLVSTSQRFRKRGIGKNLIIALCLEAKSLGYESVVLQASSLGEQVYKKLGFVTFCSLGRYEVL